MTHAWVVAPGSTRWLAASVAAVPPAVLLAAVHGIAVLVGAGVSGAVYRAAVAATVALAAGAFVLSFVALRDLAVLAGIAPGLAVVFPLVIDLGVGVATVALVAVGDRPSPRSATAMMPSTPPTPSVPVSSGAAVALSAGCSERPGVTSPAVADAAVDVAGRAAALVATEVTRQSVETVQAILEAHDRGTALNRIAKDVGVHHSAVRRVLDADAALDRGDGVAAGVMSSAPEVRP